MIRLKENDLRIVYKQWFFVKKRDKKWKLFRHDQRHESFLKCYFQTSKVSFSSDEKTVYYVEFPRLIAYAKRI